MEAMNRDMERPLGESAVPRRPEGRSGAAEAADPEVVAVARRRRFTREYKLGIVEQADRCRQPGQIGMLLRREGLNSSHLTNWRKLRRSAARLGPEPKRGRKPTPVNPLAVENVRLQRAIARVELRNRKLEGLIELQKKASEILGIELPPHDDLDEKD